MIKPLCFRSITDLKDSADDDNEPYWDRRFRGLKLQSTRTKPEENYFGSAARSLKFVDNDESKDAMRLLVAGNDAIEEWAW